MIGGVEGFLSEQQQNRLKRTLVLNTGFNQNNYSIFENKTTTMFVFHTKVNSLPFKIQLSKIEGLHVILIHIIELQWIQNKMNMHNGYVLFEISNIDHHERH